MKRLFMFLLMSPLLFLVSCPNVSQNDSSPDIDAEFIGLTADGSDDAVTTKLTLTFDQDITNLNGADILLLDSSTTRASRGSLTKSSGTGVYNLAISGISENGRITVAVKKYGYNITGGPMNVTIYREKNSGDFDTWNDWLATRYPGKTFGSESELGGLKDPITHNMLAEEYFFVKGLNAGWNLGNTHEGGSNPRAATGHYDKLFAGIKDAGFNVIRMPVTWGSGATGTGANTVVSATLLNDVEAAVTAAHDAGLAVFINSHHDKTFFNLNTAGPSYKTDGENGTDFIAMTERFAAVWTQIANRFKDYGDWLIFEGLNEPTYSTNGSVNWDGAPPEYHEVLNRWFQAFVNAVRATGGNNEKRYLIFKSYAAKLQTSLDPTNGFRIATDPAGPGRLVYSFHSYVPQPLGLEGQDTNWSPTHVNQYTSAFIQASDAYIKKGIPVFMGETGATFHSQRTGNDAITANKNRLYLLNALGSKAREYGVIPCLWDNGEATRTNTTNQPNGETFAMFRRKNDHDSDWNNWGLPIDHTKLTPPPAGVGNPAFEDTQFGQYTIKAFIDAVNGLAELGKPAFTIKQQAQ